MKRAHAARQGEAFVVADEQQGQRLHAKGVVGDPLPGGGLRLSAVEAAHCVHAGRLAIDGDWHAIVHGHEAAYLAYADLRDRGLVVRHDGEAFCAWRRAEQPPAAPWFRFHTASERSAVVPADLFAWAEEEAVVGVVDDDGAVTHYRVTPAEPRGHTAWPEGRASGVLLDDRVVVPGGLPGDHALGTPHGDDLVLSLTEAEALRRRGVLDVPDLSDAAQHHYARTLPVYEALRDAGVVAKSGFRFGTHFRGYSRPLGEGHAEWLIQCVLPEDRLHWSELSRAVRLAHGVRKSFLVAMGGRFVDMAWFRP